MEISACDSVGCGASKHVVLVLSNARRTKHSVPQIQLRLSKPGMATNGFVLECRRVGEEIEITEGLDAGQRVVVQGAGFLNDGDIVRVVRGQE